MPICTCIGKAAGTAAVIVCKNQCSYKDADYVQIRGYLINIERTYKGKKRNGVVFFGKTQ